jgi:hypothetical protein
MSGNFEVLPPGNYISVETHGRICKELHAEIRKLILENERLRSRLHSPLCIEDIEQAWDRTQFNGRAPISFAREIEKVLKGEV